MNLPKIETIADLISDLARAGKMFEKCAYGDNKCNHYYDPEAHDTHNRQMHAQLSEVEEDIRVQVTLLVREIK
jgi:hypothetical protein